MDSLVAPKWMMVLACVWVCGVQCQGSVVPRGFFDKYFTAKQQLTTSFNRKSTERKEIKMEVSQLWSKSLRELYSLGPEQRPEVPQVVRTEGHTIMLAGLDVWSLDYEKLSRVVTLPGPFPYPVQLIRSIEWNRKMFLLVCFKYHHCSLFTAFSGMNFAYRQTISDPGMPVDAQFFIQGNDLFLVVLFQTAHSIISQTKIYCWHSTYLDLEWIPEIVSTASSVTVFNYKESVLLILSCSGGEKMKFPSQVWCRAPNGEVYRKHYLPTSRPLSITHFREEADHYLLVVEEHQDSIIYWWEGNEFIPWMSVSGILKYFKVSTSSHMLHTTFLIFTRGAMLKIYVMNSKRLERVFDVEFHNKILSVMMFEENSRIYLLVHSGAEYNIHMALYHVHLDFIHKDDEGSGRDTPEYTLQETFNLTFSSVRALEEDLHSLESRMATLLLTDRPVNMSAVRVLGPVEVVGGNIKTLVRANLGITQAIHRVFSRLAPLQEEIESHVKSLKSTEIDKSRHLIFMNTVRIREANISSLRAELVNDRLFEPESFLSLTNQQRIEAVTAKALRVHWLAVSEIGKHAAKDVLLTENTINVPMRVARVESANINISEEALINDVVAKSLLHNSVIVDAAHDNLTDLPQVLFELKRGISQTSTLQLQDNTVIKNLNVDQIDNIPVLELIDSLFVANIKNVINGNLHFKKGLRVNELVSDRIIEPPVNPNSPQINTNVETIPGAQYPRPLNPSEHGPPYLIPIQPLNPRSENYLADLPVDGIRAQNRANKDEPIKIFKRKVKIIGNLKVGQLIFQNSTLRTGDHSVPTANFHKVFWTRSTPQVFTGPIHFEKGLKLLQGLDDDAVINNNSLRNYASVRSTFHSLVLENVDIDGDVTGDMVLHQRYSQRPGEGLKGINCKVLNVKHLKAELVNGKDLKNMVQTDDFKKYDVQITAENVTVGGNLRAKRINGVDVQRKFETAVFIDEPYQIHDIVLNKVSARNMDVKLINEYKAEELLKAQSLDASSTVHVSGDLHLQQLVDVTFVNDKPINLSQVVNRFEDTAVYGKKSFANQVVTSNNVNVTNINNVNIEEFIKNLLLNSADQVITGFYNIRRASARSLRNVSSINGLDPAHFVHINQPSVNLTTDLHFKSLRVEGNLTTSKLLDGCILPKVEKDVVFERASVWSSVTVYEDSVWPATSGGRLQQLIDTAVTTTAEQTITGAVAINNLYMETADIGTLNDKNITFILSDSLSRTKRNQVITGKKYFRGSLKCYSIKVKGDAKVGSVNGINIVDINERLVRHSADDATAAKPISGHKTFMSGFKAFSLQCPDGINAIPASFLARDNQEGVLPPMIVGSLVVVGPLNVRTINGLNIDSFIQERVMLDHSPSQIVNGQFHVIGNVTFTGPVTTPSINSISNSDVVFTRNGRSQVLVKGCKTFTRNIRIEANSEVDTLNGKNLYESYTNNVKTYQNVTINGSVVITSEVELPSIYAEEYFVGTRRLSHINKTSSP